MYAPSENSYQHHFMFFFPTSSKTTSYCTLSDNINNKFTVVCFDIFSSSKYLRRDKIKFCAAVSCCFFHPMEHLSHNACLL